MILQKLKINHVEYVVLYDISLNINVCGLYFDDKESSITDYLTYNVNNAM